MEISVPPLSRSLEKSLQQKIDTRTKPPGSLGKLEQVALQIGLIQKTLSPSLCKPHLLLFAGDHGVVAEGVSPYPQAVTSQMVRNFVDGGAAINVFCRLNEIGIDVVDAGVNDDLSSMDIIHAKVAKGTENFLVQPAMTEIQFSQAMEAGAKQVQMCHQRGTNVVGFGEMGIGNTSSAALVFSALSGIAVEECVGRGTGLDDDGLKKKVSILTRARQRYKPDENVLPVEALQQWGGFELVMMCGAMMQAAELGMLVMVDGFIATASVIAAVSMQPDLKEYCVFSHLSDEHAHQLMLDYLQVEPLVHLRMRLGEGSGVAVTYPLLEAAVAFVNEMASFDSAGVSDQE
jgi:nicotinate-nucleotide--dimethylbenzimidazole phosphoribosyltransferase